jgi:polyhydroxyalkanoate synthesis regulator phasin
MDSFDLGKLLQRGFHVTLGATASLLEVIQDPRKAQDRLDKLRLNFDSVTEELAEKGAVTEIEARNFVDGVIAQQIKTTTPNEPDLNTVNTTATTVVDSNVQADLQALTQQLADLRAELENIRQSKGQ